VHAFQDFFVRLAQEIFANPESRVAFVYIPTTVLIAYVAYVRAHGVNVVAFWRYFVPAEVYGHSSHLVDIKLMVLAGAMKVLGILSMTAVTTLAAATTYGALQSLTGWERADVDWTTGRFVVLTLVFALIHDFCTYWVHRIHHQNQVLWPLHKLHHSAEVLTPVTLYRKHPLYDLISDVVSTLVVGSVIGLVVFLFVGQIDVWKIAGINAIYFLFNMLGGNLRHSHVWVSFGPVMSRIFISPAMHQIHHSREQRHYDSNYGEVFAIWDWLFGTIYIPKEKEVIEFGLSDEHGNRIEQPHATLRDALLVPIREMAAEIEKRAAKRGEA
jgi:sterol desaturase/sphingolipid hydroxylase (fatty acid hydroxylase superfamily)